MNVSKDHVTGIADDLERARNGTAPDSPEPEKREKPKKEKPGSALDLTEHEPSSEGIPPGQLADLIHNAVRRHLVMAELEAVAVTLWILFTWVFDSARCCPILTITSPVPGCGKTTLMELLRMLARRPLPSSNISGAAVYRVVEGSRPTLLVDEADSFLGAQNEIRGILNSGHTRTAAFVIRVVGEGSNAEVRKFSTWAPKALASIGKVPVTIADRSIRIRLEKRKPSELVEELTEEWEDVYAGLGRHIARLALDHPDAAGQPVELPPFLLNRTGDNWRGLFSIASVCGGDWPARVQAAAETITGAVEDDEDVHISLVNDLRELFEERGMPEALHTEPTILPWLHERDDRPWSEWGSKKASKKPLTAAALGRLLRRFRVDGAPIKSRAVRIGDENLKGYYRDELKPLWERYPSQGVTGSQPASDAGLGANQGVTAASPCDALEGPDLALRLDCDPVTFREPGGSENGSPPLSDEELHERIAHQEAEGTDLHDLTDEAWPT